MAFLKEAGELLLRCYCILLYHALPSLFSNDEVTVRLSLSVRRLESAARFTYTKSISSNTLLGSEGARRNVAFVLVVLGVVAFSFYTGLAWTCCPLGQNI
jgi:hypothetical protein